MSLVPAVASRCGLMKQRKRLEHSGHLGMALARSMARISTAAGRFFEGVLRRSRAIAAGSGRLWVSWPTCKTRSPESGWTGSTSVEPGEAGDDHDVRGDRRFRGRMVSPDDECRIPATTAASRNGPRHVACRDRDGRGMTAQAHRVARRWIMPLG